MHKIPKIVVTNVDEDPSIKKEQKRKKITELCAVGGIVAVNWIMVMSKSCFMFGVLSGIITTAITIIQYVFFLKTHWAAYFGAKNHRRRWRDPHRSSSRFHWILAKFRSYCLWCHFPPEVTTETEKTNELNYES